MLTITESRWERAELTTVLGGRGYLHLGVKWLGGGPGTGEGALGMTAIFCFLISVLHM